MEETGGFHPIACESCRGKKSKCDRELPICSQCISSGAACRYPPTSKRGIPTGYLSLIEQRLLETELVVYELLSTIYKSQTPVDVSRLSEDRQILAQYSSKQPKTAKIEEWRDLPLNTDEQRRTWWLRRQELVSQSSLSGRNAASPGSLTYSDAWQEASPASMQIEDHSSTTLEPQLDLESQTQPSMASWQPVMSASPGPAVPFMGSTLQVPSDSPASFPAQNLPMHDMPTDGSISRAPNSAFSDTERWRKYF